MNQKISIVICFVIALNNQIVPSCIPQPLPVPSVTYPVSQIMFDVMYNSFSTDCEQLQFLLLYKLINFTVVTQVILGYVRYQGLVFNATIFPDFTATNLNLCRLDFNPADPTAFPYKVDIGGLQLINGVARGLRMDHAMLGRARFDGSDLSPSILADGCVGQQTSFKGSVVPQGTFITFIGANAQNLTKLNYADLSNVHWNNVVFKYTDLTGVDLAHSDLQTVLFSGTNLTQTNFTHARLRAAVCDPNNLPIVSNTIMASGRVTSSAYEFCRSFNHSYRPANVSL